MCCIVCLDWQKGKLTGKEVLRNIDEMSLDNTNEEELRHFSELAYEVFKNSDGDLFEE